MVDINRLKYPVINGEHNFSDYFRATPLPIHGGGFVPVEINPNKWIDKYGIVYEYKNNFLCVTKIFESVSNLDSLILHLDNIDTSVDIYLHITSVSEFNKIADVFNRIKPRRNIILDFSWGNLIRKSIYMNFEALPETVKFTNIFFSDGENNFYGSNNFDWWGLWLSENDYQIVRERLTPLAKERFDNFRNIALSFYLKYENTLRNMSNLEKMEFVYNWVTKNTTYDGGATNPDGTLIEGDRGLMAQNPIYTFQRGTGVCAGRSQLIKLLLNNCFMKVDCFLVDCNHITLPHELNFLVDDDGTLLFYDSSYRTTFRLSSLPSSYSLLHYEKFYFNLNDFVKAFPSVGNRLNLNQNVLNDAGVLSSTGISSRRIPPIPVRSNTQVRINTPPPLPQRPVRSVPPIPSRPTPPPLPVQPNSSLSLRRKNR